MRDPRRIDFLFVSLETTGDARARQVFYKGLNQNEGNFLSHFGELRF